ncbi:MAG: 50S ribosomal protein L25 [Planctomycetes bacterium]|jgi:large subunit ribosomal protein L25|nr:50S ribosomal protein L25 [Planctomycetota bacterium]
MEVANINVTEREERGRRKVAAVRLRGEIPAVIYGQDRENIHLSLAGREFTKLVMTHHKLFQLHYPGGRTVDAFLQDLQWDVLDDLIMHVDFKRISLDEKMRSHVEIRFVGQPKGVSKNGIFETVMKTVHVECLPKDLPDELRLNVNSLDVDESIHLKEVSLPEGVVALDDLDALVCHCKLRLEQEDEDEDEGKVEGDGSEPEVIGKDKEDGGDGDE